MKFARALLASAAVFLATSAHAALIFSESAPTPGLPGSAINFTSTSGLVLPSVTGSIANVRLAPLGLAPTDTYSVISTDGVTEGSATIVFAGAGRTTYSFLWGSPDTYNFLDVVTNNPMYNTMFSGSQLGVISNPVFTANGNNANTRVFTITATGGTLIESLTFRSSGIAFEVAEVPEPATLGLLGLGLLGAAARRRLKKA